MNQDQVNNLNRPISCEEIEAVIIGDHFLRITPVALTIRAKMNKLDFLKLRSFCKAKDTVIKTKMLPTEWEKIFTNSASDIGLISKIYKEFKKLDIKILNNTI